MGRLTHYVSACLHIDTRSCILNVMFVFVANKDWIDSTDNSVVTVITADIATAVDSFQRITTATAVAIDLFDGRCSVGAPLTISTAAAASDMVNSERL